MWKRHVVKPGSKLKLRQTNTNPPKGFQLSKEDLQARLEGLRQRLKDLQELLYAESKHKVLIVLQAMDSGGKDGTIEHVFTGVNPQGVDVTRFKAPSLEELDHDYLWRVHKHTPAKGEIMIFNRSHYEDVLTVKVHKLIPKETIEKRYVQINDFERMLTDEGVTILKFFLHISKEEQRDRIQERLDDPKKNWKFNLEDLRERRRWPEYMDCYQEAIRRTSTPWAPWCIIPADKKWYRNLVVSECLVSHLEALKMSYPALSKGDKL